MFELRYYRGLNDVALLPLVGTRWLIGSTELADLNLPHEVCADESFVLELVSGDLTAGRSAENVMLWRLTRVPCSSNENSDKKLGPSTLDDSISVRLDEIFSISGLTFVVSTHDTPWTIEELSINHKFGKDSENASKQLGGVQKKKKPYLKLAAAMSALLLVASGAYFSWTQGYLGFTNDNDNDFATIQQNVRQRAQELSANTNNVIEQAGNQVADNLAPQSPEVKQVTQVTMQNANIKVRPKPVLTSEHARTLFREMLDRREIGKDLVINVLSANRIEIAGHLSDAEKPVLLRTIDRFEGRYKGQVALVPNWNVGKKGLPFEIVQIVSGPMAHIITKDGKRLFIGDELDNMRLVSISSDKVVFEGQQNIEVSW
ncbi:hypothetical protein CS022_17090 [Veronia nyctiphanis]|uniref:YscD-like Bon-like domain-containing protein n=1 Tax=Veronia nyctiphanis TaxID=1278244 RepID=A0A4Q0YMY6_9GAMM|nr:hypothetical protein [Veronia nyctiphanis]RXJ72260.1 hypothetical protein CS022_17090 [Veronia nyctiphanis]